MSVTPTPNKAQQQQLLVDLVAEGVVAALGGEFAKLQVQMGATQARLDTIQARLDAIHNLSGASTPAPKRAINTGGTGEAGPSRGAKAKAAAKPASESALPSNALLWFRNQARDNAGGVREKYFTPEVIAGLEADMSEGNVALKDTDPEKYYYAAAAVLWKTLKQDVKDMFAKLLKDAKEAEKRAAEQPQLEEEK